MPAEGSHGAWTFGDGEQTTSISVNSSNLSDVVRQPGGNWEAFLLLPVIVAGISGNVLVCVAVKVERRLRNETNLFLVSLAVADLLVSCVVLPCCTLQDLMGYWPFGFILCDAWQACDVMLCTSSIMHMCTISIDRYIGIRSPLVTRNRSPTVVAIKIASVWAISALIASPVVLLAAMRPDDVMAAGSHFCNISNRPFFIYGSLMAFFLPLMIMLVAYSLTIRLLRRQARSLSAGSRRGGAEGEGGGLRRSRTMDKKRQMHSGSGGNAGGFGKNRRRAQSLSGGSISSTHRDDSYDASEEDMVRNNSMASRKCSTDAYNRDQTPKRYRGLNGFENERPSSGSLRCSRFAPLSKGQAFQGESYVRAGSSRSPIESNAPSTAEGGASAGVFVTSQSGCSAVKTNDPPLRRHRLLTAISKSGEEMGMEQTNQNCGEYTSSPTKSVSTLGELGLNSRPTEESLLPMSSMCQSPADPDAGASNPWVLSTEPSGISEGRFDNDPQNPDANSGDNMEIAAAPDNQQRRRSRVHRVLDSIRFRALIKKHGVVLRVTGNLITRRDKQKTDALNTVRTEQKAVKVLGTMFSIFVVCWAPFFTANLTLGACGDACQIDANLFRAFQWLGYVSSMVNPVVYTVFNEMFRKTFKELLLCRRATESRQISVNAASSFTTQA